MTIIECLDTGLIYRNPNRTCAVCTLIFPLMITAILAAAIISINRQKEAPMANIHKDFYGAMSYGIQYLYEKYGEAEMVEYLKQLAHTVYSPLTEALKTRGLPALYEHWDYIFTIEDADFEIGYEENDLLFLKVKKCPAICHMKERDYQVAEKYCEHCRIINEEICHSAGYECSIEYKQDKGSCMQKFWKKNNKAKEQ